MEFDTAKIVNEKLNEQIKELNKLVDALTKDKNAKEDLIKMEKEVISTFVSQVEHKEKARVDLLHDLKKLKEYKQSHKHDKTRLLRMCQQLLLKYVKKKKDNIKGAFHELGSEDRESFLTMLTEIKININKYIH